MEFQPMEKILDIIQNRYEAVRVMAKEARRINPCPFYIFGEGDVAMFQYYND